VWSVRGGSFRRKQTVVGVLPYPIACAEVSNHTLESDLINKVINLPSEPKAIYSYGSICFGSLLVALIQALRALEHHTRDNDDFQFLSCIIQCILGCLQGILEGINRWAYSECDYELRKGYVFTTRLTPFISLI
jgi:Plasma-membrane choline transporter